MLACKKHGTPIVVNSDAHFCTHVGSFEKAVALLEKIEFDDVNEKDWYNEWDDEYYYDMIPIILFAADESKYSVDDFFDDNLFNKVENEFEDLIESFEDMFDF